MYLGPACACFPVRSTQLCGAAHLLERKRRGTGARGPTWLREALSCDPPVAKLGLFIQPPCPHWGICQVPLTWGAWSLTWGAHSGAPGCFPRARAVGLMGWWEVEQGGQGFKQ